MALLIGFIDALPILGAGTVFVPWIIIEFLNMNKSLAFSLLGLYIIILVVRQLLEPKLVSNKIGIHPIFTLLAMYTGFKLIGILGMLFGPIVLIIIKSIFANILDKGIVKAIVE
jgi:predicted PurR-regulated permease PerM